MTDRNEVTQADRNRAVLIHTQLNPHLPERWATQMREGKLDGDRILQQLAKHRIAALANHRTTPAPGDGDNRPANCRFRLRDEGKPAPRSSCRGCGGNVVTGLRSCPKIALTASQGSPPADDVGLLRRLRPIVASAACEDAALVGIDERLAAWAALDERLASKGGAK